VQTSKRKKEYDDSSSSADESDFEGGTSGEGRDVLKISEIMEVAGVWKPVWCSYRSDLANRMLSLKCAETNALFADKRPAIVRGNLQVLVHHYKRSVDWHLAWEALRSTRDLYEKRVRELIDDMFQKAGLPDEHEMSILLARNIAESLRVRE
jgi:hypothetical protein